MSVGKTKSCRVYKLTACITCAAGSTQEEMGALVQQSINDSKISGGDRPVAWDGETRSGAGLQNQLKQIQDSKVGPSCSWSSRVNTSCAVSSQTRP